MFSSLLDRALATAQSTEATSGAGGVLQHSIQKTKKSNASLTRGIDKRMNKSNRPNYIAEDG